MGKSEATCDCDVIHSETVELVKERVLDEESLLLMADFYKALSDSTRIKIINVLDEGELCVCDISVLLNMTKSAVSHQLKGRGQEVLLRLSYRGQAPASPKRHRNGEQFLSVCQAADRCRNATAACNEGI